MGTTLGDLTPRDIGRQVTITTSDATITGMLRGFAIETDWITDYCIFGDAPTRVPGRQTAAASVGSWSASRLSLDTAVEVDR